MIQAGGEVLSNRETVGDRAAVLCRLVAQQVTQPRREVGAAARLDNPNRIATPFSDGRVLGSWNA
jgi:hypothetical protein